MKATPVTVVKSAFSEWSEDNAPRLAAALAYYAVFSIAPLLLIAIAVAGLVFGREAAQGQIYQELQGLLGQQGAASLQEIVQGAQKPGSGIAAGLIGVVMLLLGASGVMGELKSALNTIWEVPATKSAGVWGFVRARFFSFTMVLGVGFLLLVSLVVSAALAAMGTFFQGFLPVPEIVLHVVNFVVSFAVITGLFALIFRYVPDAKIAWKDVWLGAAVTAFLFTIGKYAIGLYLGKGSFSSTYGAAASLVIFLAWVYYSAQILFFGAELTQVYANQYGSRIVPEDDDAREARERERRRQERRGHGADRRGHAVPALSS
jgi:membrane protein